MSFATIIPAAGTGSRTGRELPKQYVELLGAPVLAHTIGAFAGASGCRQIVVAVDNSFIELARRCAPDGAPVLFVRGGAERQNSVASALARVDPTVDFVLVHDAARPCVSADLIARVLEAARAHGAAIPAVPINETVKRVDETGRVLETIPRSVLRAAQTPQAFRREILVRAYDAAQARGLTSTDDASLVEAIGERVVAVEGEWENLKITVDGDFARAEEILRARG